MHYDTYKKLTKKQKEEYDYRFKECKHTLNLKGMLLLIITFISVVTLNLFITYLCITTNLMDNYKDIISEIFIGTQKLVMIGLIIIIGNIGYSFAWIVKGMYDERKWMKRENIKSYHPLIIKWRNFRND